MCGGRQGAKVRRLIKLGLFAVQIEHSGMKRDERTPVPAVASASFQYYADAGTMVKVLTCIGPCGRADDWDLHSNTQIDRISSRDPFPEG